MTAPTIHATALLVGHLGILIRGPSGAGKSRLALALLQGPGTGFSRLVGDDRICLEARNGRLLMRPPAALAGLIEVRGFGVVRMPSEAVAVAHVVVDLGAADATRLPEPSAAIAEIEGVRLARLPVAEGGDPLLLLRAFLQYGATLPGAEAT
ncbi:MAG: HPr kinase/phosphorylase [Pseudorhodoplanes sp.]|uniref:HPr kinase/phosphorylase n=1 Tax=Pseudorhodoplanes sp. TaxID=1934341 RepID=UPI003D0A32A4